MTPETDDLQPFLKSTFVIDADHPDIVATARQVTPDAQSVVDQARRLSGGFVSTHGQQARCGCAVQPSTTTTRRLPPDDRLRQFAIGSAIPGHVGDDRPCVYFTYFRQGDDNGRRCVCLRGDLQIDQPR